MAKRPTSDKAETTEELQADAETSSASSSWRDSSRVLGRRVGYRFFRLGGEVLSVTLALGIVALFFSVNLLTRQSADLTSMRPSFERWFSQSFGGATAELETLQLKWNPSDKTVTFIVSDMTVYDTAGNIVQTLDRLEATTTREDIFKRRASLRDVSIIGGEVSWVETDEGEIIAGLGSPDTVGGVGPIFRGVAEQDDSVELSFLEDFRSISLSGTRLNVRRAQDGLDISADLRQLDGEFDGEVAELFIDGALQNSDGTDSGSVSVSLKTNERFRWTNLSVKSDELILRDLAPATGRLSVLQAFDLPLNVSLEASNAADGLQAASVDFEAGSGRINLAGETQSVDQVRIRASLDPGEEVMEVEQFDVAAERLSLNASGRIFQIGRIQDGDVSTSPKFDLDVRDATLDLTPTFEGPLEFQSADAVGELDLDTRTLTFDSLAAQFDGFSLSLSGQIGTNKTGLSKLILVGQTDTPLTAPQLLTLWPIRAADGARRWIDRSVLEGTVQNVQFDVDLDQAFFDDPQLTDGRLELTFDVQDGVVRYISTMDPLVGAKGSGRIAGNRFGFVLEEGVINDITIVGGDVDIPRLTPKGGDILISANAEGQLDSLMRLIDQPPFEYLTRYGASPDSFGGDAAVTLNIKRPLLEFFDQDRIEYSVTGEFKNARSAFRFGPYTLEQGDLTIEGGKEGLFLNGAANLGPWRADLSWAERYGQNGEPTRYRISGLMDRKTLDALGVGFREVFGGEIGVDIEATGKGLNVSEAFATVDLTPAELTFGNLWSKPIGGEGEVKVDMVRTDDVTSFPSVRLNADGLDLEGAVFLRSNFALEKAELDRLNIEGLMQGEASLSRDEDANRLKIEASGAMLDVSEFVLNAIKQAGQPTANLPISVEAAFDEIILGPDYPVSDASLAYRHDGNAVEFMNLTGSRPAGPIELKIEGIDDGMQSATMRVPDVSDISASLLGVNSLEGGSMWLEATLPPADVNAPILGAVNIEDFKARNAPFLAQILSLASLTGFVETLSGEGLSLNELSFDFGLQNQMLSVRDAKLRGSALGMTGAGEIDLSTRSLDFGGTLVPAYTANSILKDIPLFGDLLVGQDGEGIFALTYTIDGPFSQALIAINPLSALTPGFIRGIFRENREDLPESVTEAMESSQDPVEDAGLD
ncbi:MAG: AsmA-like C-terminal domain-containing protein [Pseudomonadota bacterium]